MTSPTKPAHDFSITVTGLPSGVPAEIVILGPSGVWRVSRDTTLRDVAAGTYRVTASRVTSGAIIYAVAEPTVVVDIGATAGSASASIAYQSSVNFGTLRVSMTGVSAGNGRVELTGPVARSITSDSLLPLLPPGRYTLSARPYVQSASVGFGDTLPIRTFAVVAGGMYTQDFAYVQGVAKFQMTVVGVPANLTAPVRVLKNSGEVLWSAAKGAPNATVTVPFGVNRVVADSVEDADYRYRADTASAFLEGLPSYTRPVTVTYGPRTGIVAPALNGVPTDAALTTRLEKEDGTLVATATGGAPRFTKIEAGRYVVRFDSTQTALFMLTPAVPRQTVDVIAGAVVAPAVRYAGTPRTGFNLSITGVTVVQAIHGVTAPVSLVAGREALVRVSATANGPNGGIAPSVRLELSDLSGVFKTITIPQTANRVPVAVVDSVLASTYNAVLTAADVRPNLRVRATIDADAQVADANRADNTYPASGTMAVSVVDVPPMRLVLVPTQLADSAAPVLTAAGADSLTSLMRVLWPLREVDLKIHAPVVSTSRSTDSDLGTNLIAEMGALRQTDGASLQTYYVSVVRRGAGVATMGTRLAAVIMTPEVLAHEVGHMFGRMHATTCTGLVLGGVDPQYPYANGSIGSWGWDARANALVSPKAGDIMGQCSMLWVSDYMWTGALLNRASRDADSEEQRSLAVKDSAEERGLLISGFVRGKHSTIRVQEFLGKKRTRLVTARASFAQIVVRSPDGSIGMRIPIDLVPLEDRQDEFVFEVSIDQIPASMRGGSFELIRDGERFGQPIMSGR